MGRRDLNCVWLSVLLRVIKMGISICVFDRSFNFKI